ncbi:MAG TPA: ATP-binding protein [Rhizomicrobium sp.]|nr:ATP-binding protein [Rhizomicrobium sp.]
MSTSVSLDHRAASSIIAGSLAVAIPHMSPRTTNADACRWLQQHPDFLAVPIVSDEGKVFGLVNRLSFFMRYAQQYAPELFGNKSVLRLANVDPLIVEEDTMLADLSRRLLRERPDAIIDCFIVTRNGRYLGVGTGESLMRAKVDLLTAREEELELALREAKEANRAKSEFLAVMSHELRTPLNAILGFSEIIHSLSFGSDIPRYQDYAGDIHRAGAHLLSVINDILDLSKAESGKFELHREPAHLEAIVQESVRLVRERALAAGVQMKVDLPVLPLLSLDQLRFKQILLNLLSNAVKFTPSGGTITLKGGVQPEGTVRLAVADTGIGMAPETIPIALEAYRQVGLSRARHHEGTGLGLPLVKSLVEMHGGSLSIESTLHVGTTVTIEFPASCRFENHKAQSA